MRTKFARLFRGAARKYFRLFSVELSNRRSSRSPEAALSVLLGGTVVFVVLLIALLVTAFLLLGRAFLLPRIAIGGALLFYILAAIWQLKCGHSRRSAVMVLCFYYLLATITVLQWSVDTPFGLLLFGFVVVMAGLILGSAYTLPTATLVVATLFLVQSAASHGLINPDRSGIFPAPDTLDVAGFATVLLLLALVAWVAGRQIEQALSQAVSAEEALLEEKRLLASRLAQRTRKLQAAQLKEMQQLYRFAELGQLSTALLHDLANHLTVLTLDIEDIHKKQHSRAIERAKNSIYYLDELVDKVRAQLQGDGHTRQFNVVMKTQETIAQLADKAAKAKVAVLMNHAHNKKLFTAYGDPTRFRQVLTIVISNAIDAYHGMVGNKVVKVELSLGEREMLIKVIDQGVGITPTERRKIFKPFHSTKPTGMGIGLFISREIMEAHFKGSITLSSDKGETTFILKVPIYNEHVK